MKLTILDRITIMRVLPAESDFATLKVVKEMKDKLGFNKEEMKKDKIKTINAEDGKSSQIVWDKKAHKKEIDINLVRIEREIIIKQLKELDEKKKANETHLALYEKVNKFHEDIEKKG